MSTITAMLLTFVLAPWFIRELRRKQIGQVIRGVGPETHKIMGLITKEYGGKINPETKKVYTPEELIAMSQKPVGDRSVDQDIRYRDILTNANLGKPVSREDLAWAKAYKEQKSIGPEAFGAARLDMMLKGNLVSVYDTNTGEVGLLPREDVTKNPNRYVGAELATKLKSKKAVFDEIETASRQVRDALPNINFNEGQIAKFANILGANDNGSSIRNFLGTNVAKTLTPDEINYVTAVKNLKESAYALRNVSGMGQGSDEMRAAIADVIPGPRTPNAQYADKALNRFDTQVKVLKSGVPGLGNVSPNEQPKPSPAAPVLQSTNPLVGKPAGRYKVNGKVIAWDGQKEL
jgi:hypothetical protein